jgi:hypothetical protein
MPTRAAQPCGSGRVHRSWLARESAPSHPARVQARAQEHRDPGEGVAVAIDHGPLRRYRVGSRAIAPGGAVGPGLILRGYCRLGLAGVGKTRRRERGRGRQETDRDDGAGQPLQELGRFASHRGLRNLHQSIATTPKDTQASGGSMRVLSRMIWIDRRRPLGRRPGELERFLENLERRAREMRLIPLDTVMTVLP